MVLVCNSCPWWWGQKSGNKKLKEILSFLANSGQPRIAEQPLSNNSNNSNLYSTSHHCHVCNPRYLIMVYRTGLSLGKKLEVSWKGWMEIQSTLSLPGPLQKPSSFPERCQRPLGVKQGCCQSAGTFSAPENVSVLPLYRTSSCLCALPCQD